jgi:hypothetical protein
LIKARRLNPAGFSFAARPTFVSAGLRTKSSSASCAAVSANSFIASESRFSGRRSWHLVPVTVIGNQQPVGLFFGQEPHQHAVTYFIARRGKFSLG